MRSFILPLLIIVAVVGMRDQLAHAQDHPNVLFIAIDDLNDWIGCLGGHPQTLTPNLDRLASDGTLFTNAHCAAPACNPSRSAIFTGRAPNQSGLYDNRQPMREVMPNDVLIPKYFHNHGYWSAGSGKLLHYFIDAPSWDEYYPPAETENPFPQTYEPQGRPLSLPRGGPWQYTETDWGALDVTDEEFGGDWSVSRWIGEQLEKKHERPFFLACGIYRPHEPWFVPKAYFEPFPLESIQIPPGYLEDDLEDVPAAGVRAARNRYFAHIRSQGQWKQGIQGYLASIHFADAMLGRVIKALNEGPNATNTIVVLWSDHGWQLGEKEHWQKYTAWRAVTRVPLIIRVPPNVAATLPSGTTPNTICDAPVNLLSLFPTLIELCDLPAKEDNDGPSLVPLLADPDSKAWDHNSVTYLSRPNSYSISGRRFRYIHYADGGEELYDIKNDPFEFTNLISSVEFVAIVSKFRRLAPRSFAKKVAPSVESLVKLPWHPLEKDQLPRHSDVVGNPFPVYFFNSTTEPVELCLFNREGKLQSFGKIAPKARSKQQTRPGAVWIVRDPKSAQPLGFFRVDDRSAQAIIPETVSQK